MFFPAKLENPSLNEDKLGFCFEFSADPKVNLLDILTRVQKTTKYCIPFRWISTDCKYINPIGYKYLEFFVTNDQKTVYKFHLDLPWKRFGYFINDNEGNKICSLINSQRTLHKNIVNNAKTTMISQVSVYTTNQKLVDAATATGASLEKVKTDLHAEVVKLQEENTKLKNEREKEQKILDKVESEYQTKTLQLNQISTNMAALSSQIKESEGALHLIGTNTVATANSTEELRKKIDTALSTLDTGLGKLSVLAPTMQNHINEVKVGCIMLNQTAANAALNAIIPTK